MLMNRAYYDAWLLESARRLMLDKTMPGFTIVTPDCRPPRASKARSPVAARCATAHSSGAALTTGRLRGAAADLEHLFEGVHWVPAAAQPKRVHHAVKHLPVEGVLHTRCQHRRPDARLRIDHDVLDRSGIRRAGRRRGSGGRSRRIAAVVRRLAADGWGSVSRGPQAPYALYECMGAG